MWVLLWTVVVLGSAAFLGALGYRVLTRQILPALDVLERTATDFPQRWNAAVEGQPAPLRTPAPSAVFTPVHDTRAAYRSGRDQRQTARLIRRMQRKEAQGLPQRYRDLIRAEQKGLRHGPLG
ncbi:Histidine kinase [Kocuria varians]